MKRINMYLLNTLFDKNIDLYNEFIDSVKHEYNYIIKLLSLEKNITNIRKLVHNLVNVIGYFENCNFEMMYYCRMLLSTDKKCNDVSTYLPYIEWIICYDKSHFGF